MYICDGGRVRTGEAGGNYSPAPRLLSRPQKKTATHYKQDRGKHSTEGWKGQQPRNRRKGTPLGRGLRSLGTNHTHSTQISWSNCPSVSLEEEGLRKQ